MAQEVAAEGGDFVVECVEGGGQVAVRCGDAVKLEDALLVTLDGAPGDFGFALP